MNFILNAFDQTYAQVHFNCNVDLEHPDRTARFDVFDLRSETKGNMPAFARRTLKIFGVFGVTIRRNVIGIELYYWEEYMWGSVAHETAICAQRIFDPYCTLVEKVSFDDFQAVFPHMFDIRRITA